MKKYALILCLVLPFYAMYGQESVDTLLDKSMKIYVLPIDSFKAVYAQETIYLDGNGFTKNDMSITLGFANTNLKAELIKSGESTQEYKQYKKYLTRGLVLYVGGVVGVVVVTVATANPVGLVFVIPTVMGLLDLNKSTKHFHKAIWVYNRDMLIDNMKVK